MNHSLGFFRLTSGCQIKFVQLKRQMHLCILSQCRCWGSPVGMAVSGLLNAKGFLGTTNGSVRNGIYLGGLLQVSCRQWWQLSNRRRIGAFKCDTLKPKRIKRELRNEAWNWNWPLISIDVWLVGCPANGPTRKNWLSTQSFPEVRLDLLPLVTDHDTLIAHQPSTIQVLIGG